MHICLNTIHYIQPCDFRNRLTRQGRMLHLCLLSVCRIAMASINASSEAPIQPQDVQCPQSHQGICCRRQRSLYHCVTPPLPPALCLCPCFTLPQVHSHSSVMVRRRLGRFQQPWLSHVHPSHGPLACTLHGQQGTVHSPTQGTEAAHRG